ncbi:hypothetical protein FO519_007850 [Halicephalobus sp. NKZ332]|nr:hypothetical protein FO519_007850 [Halicephalobus sp. NKZ332]
MSYEVEKIVDSRFVRGRHEFLIKWKGYPDEQNTWEPENNLDNCQDALTEFHKRIRANMDAKSKKRVTKRKTSVESQTESSLDHHPTHAKKITTDSRRPSARSSSSKSSPKGVHVNSSTSELASGSETSFTKDESRVKKIINRTTKEANSSGVSVKGKKNQSKNKPTNNKSRESTKLTDFPDFVRIHRQTVEFVNYLYNDEFSNQKCVPILNPDASKKEFDKKKLRHVYAELFSPRKYLCIVEGYDCCVIVDEEDVSGTRALMEFRISKKAHESLLKKVRDQIEALESQICLLYANLCGRYHIPPDSERREDLEWRMQTCKEIRDLVTDKYLVQKKLFTGELLSKSENAGLDLLFRHREQFRRDPDPPIHIAKIESDVIAFHREFYLDGLKELLE